VLGAELLNASAQVIAARTGRMVQGLTDPAGQDLAELSLMTTEKTEALAAAAAALSVRAGAVGERLGQAALDVFMEEPTEPSRWADVPNLVLTPHTAGATTAGVQGMLMLLMQNLQAHFADQPLKTPVE